MSQRFRNQRVIMTINCFETKYLFAVQLLLLEGAEKKWQISSPSLIKTSSEDNLGKVFFLELSIEISPRV